MANKRGFTLLELMIVLTVVGIIMAIALPTFNAQMRKSRRSEALSRVQQLALEQEKWRSNNPTYGTCVNIVAGTLDNYDLTCTNLTATRYTLTATAKVGNDQNNDKSSGVTCTPLVYDWNSGTLGKTPANCWK